MRCDAVVLLEAAQGGGRRGSECPADGGAIRDIWAPDWDHLDAQMVAARLAVSTLGQRSLDPRLHQSATGRTTSFLIHSFAPIPNVTPLSLQHPHRHDPIQPPAQHLLHRIDRPRQQSTRRAPDADKTPGVLSCTRPYRPPPLLDHQLPSTSSTRRAAGLLRITF